MDSGGIVKGPSHEEGGVPFVVTGTGQAIEVEGREAVITARAFEDKSVYTYKGTNFEILNQINQRYGGNALWEEVESIGPNDFVICIVSTEDETVREITGTNEQVVSAINESGGCKATKRGAEVVEILNGRRNKLKDGGPIDGKREQLYRRWKQLVNMSASELERFYESEEGKEAGLSAGEAKKQGIKSGRESARWIIKMKRTPKAATEIALDHLYERKDYYDMLHNAEKMARGGKAAAQTIASVDLIDVYKIKFQETYGFKYDELNAEFDEWASKEKGLNSAFLRAFQNVKEQQGKYLIYDDVARDFFQIWVMLPNSLRIPAEKKRIPLNILSEEPLEVRPPLETINEKPWSFRQPGDYVELLEDFAGEPDGFGDYLGKVAFDVSDPDIVVAVATDANILAVVQCDNGIVKDIKAPKHGTRLYDVKNGKGEDANFPNYKLTVDDAVNNNNAELDGFDPLEVLTAVRSSVRLNKFFDTGRAKPILFGLEFVPKEVGEDEQRRFYDPKLIDTAFTLFARLGVGYVTAKTNLSGQKALLLEGRSDLVRGIVRVLVMPVYATENTYYTITYNYAIPRKQKPDNEEPKEEQAPAPAPAPVHSPAPQPSSSSVPAFDTPTGEPSKLTFMQQLLVRTDAFKGFFGDWEAAYERSPDLFTGYAGVSKVVEPLTREPMVVFHGTKTDKEFYEFDVYAKKIKGRPYGYFAVNEEYSHRFREMSQTGTGDNKLLYNCFLSIKKPFHAEGFDDLKKDADGWLAAIQKVVHFDLYGSHGQNAKLRQAIDDQIGDYVRKTYDNNREDFFWLLMARDVERTFKNFLMAYGYDGVIYYENFTGIYDKNNPSEYTKAFVIFDATQVKLADGRNLTFDPFSPDIRMEEGGPVIEERAASETPAATGFESMRRKMLGEATESESSTIHQFRAGGPISQDENEKWLNNFINQSHG